MKCFGAIEQRGYMYSFMETVFYISASKFEQSKRSKKPIGRVRGAVDLFMSTMAPVHLLPPGP